MKKLALLLLLLSASANAQLQRWDYFASTTTGTGSLVPLLVIPGAGIKFYSCSGAASTTCTTLLTTYTDITGGTSCPTSTQVVLLTTSTCVSTADVQGNFGVWVPTSSTFGYAYTITVSGTVFGPYQFTVGGGSGGGGANFPSSGTPCTVYATSTTVSVCQKDLLASQYATIPLLVTACGATDTKIIVDTAQSFTLSGNATFPSNCSFDFVQGGKWTTAGAFTLTFNGTVEGNVSSHFAGAATVKFGTLVSLVPLEWFGGKNDATGSTGVGTDNLAAFNAAIGALSAGSVIIQSSVAGANLYRITGPIVIAKPSVGIQGIGGADLASIPVVGNGSTILIDSASADAIDVNVGAAWNFFLYFNIFRSQIATGTAKGLAVVGTPSNPINGTVVEGVDSQDSVYPFYCKGCQAAGVGHLSYNRAGWDQTGLVSSVPSGAAGFFIDSADGTLGNPLVMSYNDVESGTNGAGITGLLASGINLSEMKISYFRALGLDYGIDLEITGTNNFVANVIHLNESILDVCGVVCLKVNGQSSLDTAPYIYLQGGVFFATGATAVGMLLENTRNIAIIGGQFVVAGTGSAAETDISLSSVQGFQINGNQFGGESFVNVSCLNSSHGTINDNQISNGNGSTGAAGIKLVGCTYVSTQGNTIAGNGLTSLNTGMSFDSGSSNNGPWSLNKIDSSQVTTPVSDAGTNNNPALIAGTNVTITGTWPNQTINSTASGGAVSSVSNSDGSLTISPTTGAVVASLNVSHANNWTGVQTFTNGFVIPSGGVGTFNTGGFINANELNGTLLSGLATGILKNTTSTGVPSIAGSADILSTLSAASHTVLGNTTGSTAAPTFTAAPVVTSILAGTSLLNSTGINTSGNDFTFNISSANLFLGVSSGATVVQVPAGNTFELGALSGCLAADATTHIVTGSGICTTSTSLTSGFVPKASGANSLVNSTIQDTGTVVNMTEPLFGTNVNASGTVLGTTGVSGPVNICADTSGSGTAQVCSTATSFTPAAGACVAYTTTTTNSGTGLTLNVNSLGAKSIAIAGASGWTTTLTASIIPANKPTWACYDGTNWNVMQTGTVASGGTPAYPLNITGGVSGGVVYGNSSTQLTVSPAGTANVLMKWGGAATAPQNSTVTDNGTTVTSTATGGYVAPVFVANGTTAGFIDFPQGTTSVAVAPCNTATSICEQAPTSVTSYLVIKPGVAGQGIQTNTLSSATITQGYSGDANHAATVTTGSGTSIGSTSLCSTAICPAGTYRVNVYTDITTACGTTGSYIVNLIYTDDQGSKTVPINLQGTGSVPLTGTLTTTSTSNFGQQAQIIRSTGAASINYSTTATACGTAGPMVGKLYLSVEPVQ